MPRSESLRVLLVGDYIDDPRLGSSKVPHKLREEFISRGHHCRLLFREDIGARPANVRSRALLGPLLSARAVAKACREDGDYDVIDLASADGFIVGVHRSLGAYGNSVLISRSHGVEHVDFRRTLDDNTAGLQRKTLAGRVWSPLVRLPQVAGAARLADRMIVLNEVDRAYVIDHRWKPASAVHVVPHGVSTRYLASAPDSGAPRGGGILFASTWTVQKGVHYLAKAFSELIRSGPPVNLTVIGDLGQEHSIRSAFSAEAQLHLTVLPRASEEELIVQYRTHDVMVMASTYEGFGMVLLEAMTQGLAVVSTPVGCGASLVRDGETGLLIPSRDATALTAALRRLMGDAAERRRLGQAAHAAVSGMSWASTADQTLTVYAQAISDRRRRM